MDVHNQHDLYCQKSFDTIFAFVEVTSLFSRKKKKLSVKFETRNRDSVTVVMSASSAVPAIATRQFKIFFDIKRNQRNMFFFSAVTEEETSNLSCPTTEC